MKEPRMGHTKMYFPLGALSLVPQIAAFHKKLLLELKWNDVIQLS